MEQQQIDLRATFDKYICSFEVAKKAKEAGMTCANTFYAYDVFGKITDGGWMDGDIETGNEMAKMAKELRKKNNLPPIVMYPAISLPFAIGLLEDTKLDANEMKKLSCYEFNEKYFIKYKEQVYQSEKLVDIIVEFWIKNKK